MDENKCMDKAMNLLGVFCIVVFVYFPILAKCLLCRYKTGASNAYTICFFVFICICIICITVICIFALKYFVKICKLEKLKLLDEKTLNCIVSCDGAEKDAKTINISFGNNSKEIFKAYANTIAEL